MKRTLSSATRFHQGVRGFTLIELLVVVAIIAVLISILLPGLQQARSYALQAACGSNMKQTASAIMMYTGDNNGVMPYDLVMWNDSRLSGLTNRYWQQLLLTYLGNNPKAVVDPRYDIDSIVGILRSRGGAYENTTVESLSANNYYHWFSSGQYPMIGYNHFLGCEGENSYWWGGVSPSKYIRMNISKITDPSSRVMCLDSGYSFGVGLWRSCGMDKAYQEMHYFPNEIRHRNGVNISFVDGHVEWDEVSMDSKYVGLDSAQYWCEDGKIMAIQRKDGVEVEVLN